MERQKCLLAGGETVYSSPAMEMIELDAETSFAVVGASGGSATVESASMGGDLSENNGVNDAKGVMDALNDFFN
jgi:hypothetical protein